MTRRSRGPQLRGKGMHGASLQVAEKANRVLAELDQAKGNRLPSINLALGQRTCRERDRRPGV